MAENNGYIKLHRKLLKWCWWNDRDTRDLFIYLLLAANWEDKPFEGITVKRGQLLTSLASLSENVGISTRSVRTALKHLISTSEVTTETTNRWTLVTIVNFEKYQGRDKKATSKMTSYLTNDRQASDKQATTTKEYKEFKNIKNTTKKTVADVLSDSDFDILEKLYGSENVREIVDRAADAFVGRDLSELAHPLQYCMTLADRFFERRTF